MKVFKFHIWEHWFGGTKERILEVKARTIQSAEKKLRQIQGNRDWEYKLVAESLTI
jgi:hypothetical protein